METETLKRCSGSAPERLLNTSDTCNGKSVGKAQPCGCKSSRRLQKTGRQGAEGEALPQTPSLLQQGKNERGNSRSVPSAVLGNISQALQNVDSGPAHQQRWFHLQGWPAFPLWMETDRQRERGVDESGPPPPQLVGDAVTRQPPGRPLSARGQLSGGIIAVSDEIRLHAA